MGVFFFYLSNFSKKKQICCKIYGNYGYIKSVLNNKWKTKEPCINFIVKIQMLIGLNLIKIKILNN